jgi:WxL Interacting Protein, peptidoglycan binding domain
LTRFNKKISIITLGLIIIISGVFVFFEKALSQSDEELGIPKGVQLSPARVDWDLKSGEERNGIINLKNFSDKDYKIEVEIENFYVSDDSSEARFFVPDESHPLKAYDVIDWIEMPQKELYLNPKESKDFHFKVKVPEDTPTGGYYGAIFFKAKVSEENIENQNGGSSKLIVNQRVGVLLVMAVKGNEPIERSGELLSFLASKKIFFQNPTELIAEVKNSGNLHYKTFGKIDIYKFGKKLTSLELAPSVLYPNKTREFRKKWIFSSWSYGYYKAKINLASEDEEIRMAGETSFWVIPWKTTLSIIILLVIIWLIFRIFTSRFEIKKKNDDDNDDNEGQNQEQTESFDNFDDQNNQEEDSEKNLSNNREPRIQSHDVGLKDAKRQKGEKRKMDL